MPNESIESMQQAVQAKTPESFRTHFTEIDNLPPSIAGLNEVSKNFYWSWHPEGVELFRDLDPDLWDICEQNPRVFLKRISELRLWQQAGNGDYVRRLEAFSEELQRYLTGSAGS